MAYKLQPNLMCSNKVTMQIVLDLV